jgi:hypothetical protein
MVGRRMKEGSWRIYLYYSRPATTVMVASALRENTALLKRAAGAQRLHRLIRSVAFLGMHHRAYPLVASLFQSSPSCHADYQSHCSPASFPWIDCSS